MARNIVFAAGLIALCVGSVLLFGGNAKISEKAAPVVEQELPQHITVTGIWECVPLISGLPDDNCVTGVARDQNDAHFVVDRQLMSTIADVIVGERVQVEGVFTPAAALSSDHWQQYNFEGIISATVIQKI